MGDTLDKPGTESGSYMGPDGQEHPPSIWHCSQCRATQKSPAFELPLNWVKMRIVIGKASEHGYDKESNKTLCPACSAGIRGEKPQLRLNPVTGAMRMRPPPKPRGT